MNANKIHMKVNLMDKRRNQRRQMFRRFSNHIIYGEVRTNEECVIMFSCFKERKTVLEKFMIKIKEYFVWI